MKKINSFKHWILLVIMLGASQASFAAIKPAEEVVMQAADEIIARLTAEKELIDAEPGRLYGLVDEIIIPHFDFVSMSKWVLGKATWKGASETQRTSFVEEFKTHLVRFYAKALLEYSNEAIEYLSTESNPNSNLVMVKTKINQSGTTAVPIDYYMHVSGGEWKVVDVSIQGVSIVRTYKGSYASQIRKNGLDALISKLAERNREKAGE